MEFLIVVEFPEGGRQNFFIKAPNVQAARAAAIQFLRNAGNTDVTEAQITWADDANSPSLNADQRAYVNSLRGTATTFDTSVNPPASATPPPAGTTPPAVVPPATGITQPVTPISGVPGAPIGGTDEPTEQSFASQYRRALDQAGITPRGSPFRDYINRQVSPTFDVFRLQSALGQTQASPQEYVSGLGGPGMFGGGLTGRAGAAWSELLRQRQGGARPTAEPFLEADPGETYAGLLAGVGRRAARQQYGTWGASFLPGESELYQRYLAQPVGQQGTQTAYLDYLRNALGLYV